MSDEASRLHPAFYDLKRHADQEKVDLHPSFFCELQNYSRHDGVRELPLDDLHRAIVGLGRGAIWRGGPEVGAGAVRQVIVELCDDPNSTCQLAAERLLKKEPAALKILVRGDEQRLIELPDGPFEAELPDGPFGVRRG